jgi:hypothetical protein
MRSAELRVNRGGIAIMSAMMTREYFEEFRRVLRQGGWRRPADIRRAYREGRWTTIDDPGRVA